MSRALPKIAVTMGDPAGVGPEVCLHLLRHAPVIAACVPVVFGDAGILRRVAEVVGVPFTARTVTREEFDAGWAKLEGPAVVDLGNVNGTPFVHGRISAQGGEAAYQYIIAAIEAGLAGKVAAVTTGPINKEALHAAGHHYPGHTEIFAERMNAERSCMMLTSEELTCSFVTTHVGYHEVPALLTVERIVEVIELTHEAMQRIRGRKPKLLACGLNPHAGEHGLFGKGEEERIISPALEVARGRGIEIEGPLPPDTAFLPWRRRTCDAVVCMYHDQGHIPLKALAFDSAINTTLGLPVVRTSVDHGTAFDIAWQGEANPNSLYEATLLAAKLGGPAA
jgi:4-phospho-D-threonate 3-dehydrogenase / 4-phospho-D-erythronate 3-dehydrogenase